MVEVYCGITNRFRTEDLIEYTYEKLIELLPTPSIYFLQFNYLYEIENFLEKFKDDLQLSNEDIKELKCYYEIEDFGKIFLSLKKYEALKSEKPLLEFFGVKEEKKENHLLSKLKEHLNLLGLTYTTHLDDKGRLLGIILFNYPPQHDSYKYKFFDYKETKAFPGVEVYEGCNIKVLENNEFNNKVIKRTLQLYYPNIKLVGKTTIDKDKIEYLKYKV